jgi:hypothetical protein
MRNIHASPSTTTRRVSFITTVSYALDGRLLLAPFSAPLLLALHFVQPVGMVTVNKFHEV